ncbi:MAG: hypothetical protein QM664_05420 [Flavihumibacter sp.]
MKKLLFVLAIGAFAACNNAAETSTEAALTLLKVDSAVTATVDSAKANIDSTANAAVDTLKAKVDSLKK